MAAVQERNPFTTYLRLREKSPQVHNLSGKCQCECHRGQYVHISFCLLGGMGGGLETTSRVSVALLRIKCILGVDGHLYRRQGLRKVINYGLYL